MGRPMTLRDRRPATFRSDGYRFDAIAFNYERASLADEQRGKDAVGAAAPLRSGCNSRARSLSAPATWDPDIPDEPLPVSRVRLIAVRVAELVLFGALGAVILSALLTPVGIR